MTQPSVTEGRRDCVVEGLRRIEYPGLNGLILFNALFGADAAVTVQRLNRLTAVSVELVMSAPAAGFAPGSPASPASMP